MSTFEYDDIIDYWTTEYGIEFNEWQRGALIRMYQKSQTIDVFKDLGFDAFTKNVVRQKFYDAKYPKLDIFGRAYSKINQN